MWCYRSRFFQLLLLRHSTVHKCSDTLEVWGIFSDSIIANFLLILTLKNLENRLMFGEVKAYKSCAIFGVIRYRVA